MRRAIIVLGIIALFGFIAFRSLFGGQTDGWHQRLTVAVNTPEGEITGSAVTAIQIEEHSGILVVPQARGVKATVTGEAVAVEVDPGRWLFALLDGAEGLNSNAQGWVYVAYGANLRAESDVRLHDLVMAAIHSQPYDTPVTLPSDAWPLMVTFDDIARPETVRRVDPDDLDAVFGCARDAAQPSFPWRVAGLTYREWVAVEVVRLSREMASERSGLPGPVGDAITEFYFISDDHYYNAADKLRLAELRTQFTDTQQRTWRAARRALEQELPATLPTPQSVAASTGGPCHSLKVVTLEITREAVTEGRVEAVLRWINNLEKFRTDPNNPFTNTLPREIGYLRSY